MQGIRASHKFNLNTVSCYPSLAPQSPTPTFASFRIPYVDPKRNRNPMPLGFGGLQCHPPLDTHYRSTTLLHPNLRRFVTITRFGLVSWFSHHAKSPLLLLSTVLRLQFTTNLTGSS